MLKPEERAAMQQQFTDFGMIIIMLEAILINLKTNYPAETKKLVQTYLDSIRENKKLLEKRLLDPANSPFNPESGD